jgi:hypothetical protein
LDDYKAKKRHGTAAELLARLRSLNIPTDRSIPQFKSAGGDSNPWQIEMESEPGIVLAGTLYTPAGPGKRPAVLLVKGKLSDWIAERAVKAGHVVLELEPRHSLNWESRRPYVGDYLADERATQIGRSLPGLRAFDILRGVDFLAGSNDVDAGSIRAGAQGVKGIWLLLAAAVDPRISKVWLDKTPYSLLEALHNTLNTELSDAVIPGFALRWDLDDLAKTMGTRPLLWTDPTNWMARVVNAGPGFRYRYVLGDITEMSEAQDEAYLREFLQ